MSSFSSILELVTSDLNLILHGMVYAYINVHGTCINVLDMSSLHVTVHALVPSNSCCVHHYLYWVVQVMVSIVVQVVVQVLERVLCVKCLVVRQGNAGGEVLVYIFFIYNCY